MGTLYVLKDFVDVKLLLDKMARGLGAQIGFSADPVGVGVRVCVGVGVTKFLYPRYLFNQEIEFHQTCMDILLGKTQHLIFKVTGDFTDKFLYPYPLNQ